LLIDAGQQRKKVMTKTLAVLVATALLIGGAATAIAQDGGSPGGTKQQHTGVGSPDTPASQNNTAKPDTK
jgi:hypothetical protein